MKKFISAIILVGAVSSQAQVASAPAAAAPKENSIALGATMTDGNSDTLLTTVSATHDRKRENYNLRLAIDYAYGKADGTKNTDNAKGVADYRYLLNDRAYVFGNLMALTDDIADISHRVVLATGPGYYLIKNEKATLGVDVGPAYLNEKVGGDENSDLALRFGERYERQLSPTAKCWQALEYLPLVDDFGDYLLNSEIGVEAAINSSASIRLVLKNAYDSTPATDREKSDTTIIGALAYQL